MLFFYLKFIITNIFFSVILSTLFMRFNKGNKHSNSEILLYSLGLGPVFTSLLLYYLFFFVPNRSNLFYLAAVVAVYLLIGILGRNSYKNLFLEGIKNLKSLIFGRRSGRHQLIHIIPTIIICIPLALYLFVYIKKILHQPLIGHDILNFGIMGKYLYEYKSLEPIWVRNYVTSGYSYKILHAPSFSLILTWEKLINSFFHVKSDLYFKSISAYYGLLILCVQYYLIAKINKWVSIVAVFALLSGLAFFQKLFHPHIDTYRIFFYVISLIYLVYTIKENDPQSLLMLGIFSGITAYAHRIGVVLAFINCVTLILFLKGSWKDRILRTGILIILIIFFGGSHYLFDIIWGLGAWIRA